jgi:hypothetical protein
MVEALAAKNSEIEALVSSMDALKKQAALAEGNLASLQVHHSHHMHDHSFLLYFFFSLQVILSFILYFTENNCLSHFLFTFCLLMSSVSFSSNF